MKSRLPDLALWAVAFVWGGTFLATRIALGAGSGPFFFVGMNSPTSREARWMRAAS